MHLSNVQVTIAIVCYNSYDAINNCMSDLIDSQAYPVIIVDNASTDGSAEKLKTRYPHVQLIEPSHNLGYGRAANLALKEANTPYVFVANPDLKLGVDAVRHLQTTLSTLDSKPTVLAPAIKSDDHLHQGVVKRNKIVGAAMLFDVAQLKKVGFFDENIFLFSEETDLCLRIREAGQLLMLDTDIYVEHLSRQSTKPSPSIDALKNWHFAWSHMYFYHKHGLAKGRKNPSRVVFMYWLKSIFAINPRKRAMYRSRFLGARSFMRGEPAILPDGSPQWPRI